MTADSNEHIVPIPYLRAVWDRLTRPAPALTEPGIRRRARMLSSWMLVLQLLGLFAVLDSLVRQGVYNRFVGITLATMAVGALLYVLSRTRYYTLAAVFSVVLMSAAAFIVSIPEPDPDASMLLVYLVIPVLLSSMLLSTRATLVLVVAQIAGMLLYEWYFDAVSPEDNWVVYITTISLLVLLSMRHQALIEQDRQRLLREKEGRYRTLIDMAPVPIAVCAPDAVLFVNAAGVRLMGARDASELLERAPESLLHPDDRHVLRDVLVGLRHGPGHAVQRNTRLLRLDGHVIEIEMTALPLTYEGRITAQLIAVDATERNLAQRALQASEERFRMIAQVTNDALYDYDLANERVWRKNGQTELFDEQARTSEWWHSDIHPHDRARVEASLAQALGDPSQVRWAAEYRLLRPGGGYACVTDRAYIVRDADGVATRLIGAITDVTEQKRVEQAEREQRNLAEALFDISTVINSTLDLDYVLEAILNTVERLVPFDGGTITLLGEDNVARVVYRKTNNLSSTAAQTQVELPVDELEDLQYMVATHQPFIVDDVRELPYWRRVPGGEAIRSHIAMPIFVGDETIGFLHLASTTVRLYTPLHAQRLAALATQVALAISNAQLYETVRQHANDLEQRVHERTAALRQALESERELGELKTRFVVMASHEFRTPLATIQATADTLYHYAERMSSDQREQSFDKIQRQVAHMADLLDDVLLAGKLEAGAQALHLKPVDVPVFLREVVADFQKSITTHVITVEGREDRVISVVDPKLLRQIVTNLLSNATKYSAPGSPITFSFGCNAEHFTFSVADEGIGIPAGDQEHLFDIFHRAANVEMLPGTGLGLAITRQAVELHNGTIDFESVEHEGTRFTVTIPIRPSDTSPADD